MVGLLGYLEAVAPSESECHGARVDVGRTRVERITQVHHGTGKSIEPSWL
jgi:hypothetical protein